MSDSPLSPTMYDFPKIYERLGMQLGHFGCIMLDVEPIDVSKILDVSDEWYYYSDNPTLRYVKGPVAETKAHVTLLYGLTPDDNAGKDQRSSVDELLVGLDLSSVTVDSIEAFPPQFKEPYACVVATLNVEADLAEANRRLRFLPHVDSFLEYRPHVTLAYVREEYAEESISKFATVLEDTKLPAVGLNYGGKLNE